MPKGKTFKVTGIPDTQIFDDMRDGKPCKSPEELSIRCVLAIYVKMQLEKREEAEKVLKDYVDLKLAEAACLKTS